MAGTATTGRPNRWRKAYLRWHFTAATTLLLAFTLIAFADNLFTDIHQPSNSDPVIVVHGLFLLAWMVLLVTQGWLAATGQIARHQNWGSRGFLVAVGVAASTLALFVSVWKGWQALSGEVLANRVFLAAYAVCMIMAWRDRRNPGWHKRWVYCGTLLLLEPVLARTFDPLVVPLLPPMAPGADTPLFIAYMVLVWSGFFLALLAYDRLRDGRFHPVSLGGLAALYLTYAIAIPLAPQPWL